MTYDGAVIACAVRLVAAARGVVDDYAGPGAPLTADQLRALLAGSGCHVELFPFHSDALGMTLPRVAGMHPVLVSTGEAGIDRCLALRHQVAHVLAPEPRGAVCLAREGIDRPAERVADLFALADALPGWWMSGVARAACSWPEVDDRVAQRVSALARAWPPRRVADRTHLRIRLFCEHGM